MHSSRNMLLKVVRNEAGAMLLSMVKKKEDTQLELEEVSRMNPVFF